MSLRSNEKTVLLKRLLRWKYLFSTLLLTEGLFFTSLLGLFFLFPGIASIAQETPRVHVLCRWGDQVVRTLRLEKKGNFFVTYYLRAGSESPVSRSTKYEEPLNVLRRIQKNLEAGNYQCKDISQSMVTESPGVSALKDPALSGSIGAKGSKETRPNNSSKDEVRGSSGGQMGASRPHPQPGDDLGPTSSPLPSTSPGLPSGETTPNNNKKFVVPASEG